MIKKEIETKKSGRYFLLGNPACNLKSLWLVCHGYGQLADSFIKNFEVLDKEDTLIAAPEGLHRFYLKGFSGGIGASWMTKEERESDINDHTFFLSGVYKDIMENFNTGKFMVNLLGFSQGTATICRWIVRKNIKPDNLILWGGRVPPDIDYPKFKQSISNAKFFLVVGEKDKYIDEEKIKNEEEALNKFEIPYMLIRYKGGHEISKDVLIKLNKLLEKK